MPLFALLVPTMLIYLIKSIFIEELNNTKKSEDDFH